MTKQKLGKHIASAFVLIVFGILAVGSIDPDTDMDTEKIQAQTPIYTVTANQLYHEYVSNEVAADLKYKGKVIIISGIIQEIGLDIMDDAYIIIGGTGFLDGVQCLFTTGQQSSVARVSKGQRVAVKCEVSGKMGNILVYKSTIQ